MTPTPAPMSAETSTSAQPPGGDDAVAGRAADHGADHGVDRRARRRRRSAIPLVVGALLLTGVLLGHRRLPGELGFLVETALVFAGLGVPLLLLWALRRRSHLGAAAALVPLVAWALAFVPAWVPLGWSAPDAAVGAGSLMVASQNVAAGSGTAGESAATLAATGAQVIGLQELDGASRREASAALAASHPHTFTAGTVGLFSQYPIEKARALELGLGWSRALRAVVDTPSGPVAVYVVHAASARVGAHDDRDEMLSALTSEVQTDDAARVLVIGDLNAVPTDRSFTDLASLLHEPNLSSGGPAVTWPKTLPLLALDHVLGRGVTFTERRSIVAGRSDHLATVARFNL